MSNHGAGILHGTVAAASAPFMVTAGAGPFALNHGQSLTVTVQFTPPSAGRFIGTVAVTSDDPARPKFSLKLSGAGK
jgi:hypothetical protein